MSERVAAETKATPAANASRAGGLRAQLELRVLGGVSLGWVGGGAWSPSRREVRRLYAHLVLQFDRPLDRRALAFRLWPDVLEEVALNRLRRMLNALRTELKEHLQEAPVDLRADHQTISLRRHPSLWVDVVVFENACEDLSLLSDAEPEVLRQFEELLVLGCRPIDPDLCTDDAWLAGQAEFLRERCRFGLTLLRDRLLALSDYGVAARVAAQLVDLDPLSESATGELMRLHWLLGRREEALEAYACCARVIAQEQHELPAPWLQELRAAIDRGSTARELDRLLPRARRVPLGTGQGLPRPISRFFGREEQLDWLREAMEAERLVTILGPGGIGKTRLAIEASWANEEAYPDGIYFLPLDEITIDEGVAVFLVQLLGHTDPLKVSAVEQAVRLIGNQRLLLVLDNCEHVQAGAETLVATVLDGCANVGILATSRRVLSIPERRELRLGSLYYPHADTTYAPDELTQAASVALFIDRMEGMGMRRIRGTDDLRTIARVCRRLEGIPLAIELAAARTTIMSLTEIEKSIDGHLFSLLDGPPTDAHERHHAMWSTIEWSYRMLDEADQKLLQHLAVFPYDFNAEAVERLLESVGDRDEEDASRCERKSQRVGLAHLLDCSLVRAVTTDGLVADATDRDPNQEKYDIATNIRDSISLAHRLIEQVFARTNDLEGQLQHETIIDVPGEIREDNLTRASLAESYENTHSGSAEEVAQQRYTMYSVVREFALQFLRDSGGLGVAREVCIEYYAQFAARAGAGYSGPDQAQWHRALQFESTNLVEVMRWIETNNDWDRALSIALSLSDYWYQTVRLGMELEWVNTVLINEPTRPHDKLQSYVKLRHRYAIMLYGAGRLREAIEIAEACLNEPQYTANPEDGPKLLFHLAVFQQAAGHFAEAEQYCRKVLESNTTRDTETWALGFLAFLTHRTVGAGEALVLYEQALAKAKRDGASASSELDHRDGLGYALCSLGRYREAVEQFVISINGSESVGALQILVTGLLGVALCCNRQERGGGLPLASRVFMVARSLNSLALVSLACNHVGEGLVDMQDFQRAKLYLESALRQYRQIGDRQGEAYSACALIEANIELGLVSEASRLVKATEKGLCSLVTNRDLHARYKRAKAIYHCSRSENTSAVAMAREALSDFTAQQSVYEIAMMSHLLSILEGRQ